MTYQTTYVGSKIELFYSRTQHQGEPEVVYEVTGAITTDYEQEPMVHVWQSGKDGRRLYATFVGDDSGSGWRMGYAFCDLKGIHAPSTREEIGKIFSAIVHNICDPEMEADSVYTIRNLN